MWSFNYEAVKNFKKNTDFLSMHKCRQLHRVSRVWGSLCSWRVGSIHPVQNFSVVVDSEIPISCKVWDSHSSIERHSLLRCYVVLNGKFHRRFETAYHQHVQYQIIQRLFLKFLNLYKKALLSFEEKRHMAWLSRPVFLKLVPRRGVRVSEGRKSIIAEEFYSRFKICMYECK